ncbi:esterase-like activity of phytase family protein [Actinomycetospora endophytica]|uniref:Esterase-like activity of phytase family protein n=1 Tax=Actinomycetospora endophytica TaxID=2291215 RepID=A0ABS8PBK9_9PSEU|nr:esterase-like activity of phytase family protein [Actinomycetospora endophytica]MCD2195675.1 esterase-like activity of phytase family protein [Actinomycetospora endophytica]
MRRSALAALLLLALTAGCGDTPAPPSGPTDATAPSPQPCSPSTAISGWSDALEGQRFAGRTPTPQVVGNLSALAALPDGAVLALSDRSVLFTLDAAATGATDAVALADPTGKELDSESLALDRDGTVLVGDETGPQVLRIDRDGHLLGSLPIPPDVASRAKDNASFEGLALSPDGRTLVASLEEPLTGDDPGLTRLVTWTRPDPTSPAFAPAAQYAVPLPAGLGISELTATGDGRLLALERGYDKAVGNTVHLVLLDPAGATDVSAVPTLTATTTGQVRSTVLADLGACPTLGATAKQTQRNPLLDNIEGMTITGREPGGALDLLLVSDDNDSAKQVTRTYRLRTTLG